MSNGPRVPGGNPADPFPIVNAALDVYAHQEVYAADPTQSQLLTFHYLGGRWGGFPIIDGSVALADDAENYIVVERATGALSVDSTPTDWNNLDAFARVFHISTLGGERDETRDFRAGPGGVHGQGQGGGGGGLMPAPLITEASGGRNISPADAGSYIRFTAAGAKTAGFNTADGFSSPDEYHVANRGASGNLTLVGTGVTLNPPKGGTLVLEPGDTVTIKFISSTAADVFGSTEQA